MSETLTPEQWRKRYSVQFKKACDAADKLDAVECELYDLKVDNQELLKKYQRLLKENTQLWESMGKLRTYLDEMLRFAGKTALEREEKERGEHEKEG